MMKAREDLHWFKPHRLHLRLESGTLMWRFECLGPNDCDCRTVDNPDECWIAEQLPLFVEDWYPDEVLGDLSLDPICSPVLVEVATPGMGPESGPDNLFLRVVDGNES